MGHGHPAVVNAVKKQAEQYMHTMVYGEYVLTPQVQLSHLLAQHLPAPLDSVYLVNSGTEATEGAMKLAKRYTGRSEFIAASHSYHGSTQGAASLMWPTDFTQAFHPLLPGITHIEFNDDAALQAITHRTAAVVLETVQAEWGIRKPRAEWLQAIRQRCYDTGTLLILDEIQAGYGRTGTLWAFEQYHIVPDILLLAKGMGGGMPIGAFVAAKEVMQCLSHDPVLGHITTFGGHPVSAAAAVATLETLIHTPYIQEVKKKEALLLQRLQHRNIRQVRTAGLWAAIELDSFEAVQQVIQYGLAHGIIVDWFLFNNRSIRIAPPLTITEAELNQACDILLAGISKL
ncbi:MAG: aspartate aminotransferase family protein [Saprospiraceae bacterium]